MPCFLMRGRSGNIHREKRTGTRTEHSGTPSVKGAEEEETFSAQTKKLLFSKFDLSHFRAVPRIPTHFSSLVKSKS